MVEVEKRDGYGDPCVQIIVQGNSCRKVFKWELGN
jgi:hypothetical protein